MKRTDAFSLDDVVVERAGQRNLDGVSDHIHKASATGVVGPCGSGKSTFLRLLNRFEEPTPGVIRLDGQPLVSYDVHALRRRVGLVAQDPTMLTPTIGAEVRLARPQLGADDVRHLLERVALPGTTMDRETSTSRAASSGGWHWLARTPSSPGSFLGEPTSALNEHSARAVDRVIRSLVADGSTVVLVSHDLNRVMDGVDAVLVLDHGRLGERGAPREVRYLS